MPDITCKRLTPVLVVDAVQPSIDFWEKRLGFTKTVEVPHENTVGFAILVKGDVEVMLQSVDSVRADLGKSGDVTGRSTALFMEVSDLAAVEAALQGYPIELPRRTTFYGMHEVGVKEPGGHFIIFAQPTQD
jgi:uncharacterized glyoxalase superfamily protein PhnB